MNETLSPLRYHSCDIEEGMFDGDGRRMVPFDMYGATDEMGVVGEELDESA